MNFREALIAYLNGENAQINSPCRVYGEREDGCNKYRDFGVYFAHVKLEMLDYLERQHENVEFRLSPRTITVNGVEVPAPESVAPEYGCAYYYPHHMTIDGIDGMQWCGSSHAQFLLQRGLVYLNKEDAIARAKAMLLHE